MNHSSLIVHHDALRRIPAGLRSAEAAFEIALGQDKVNRFGAMLALIQVQKDELDTLDIAIAAETARLEQANSMLILCFAFAECGLFKRVDTERRVVVVELDHPDIRPNNGQSMREMVKAQVDEKIVDALADKRKVADSVPSTRDAVLHGELADAIINACLGATSTSEEHENVQAIRPPSRG